MPTSRTKRRNAAEAVQGLWLIAVIIGLFFLVMLRCRSCARACPAFHRTVVEVEFTLTQEQFDEAEAAL
jgi:phosphate transport system permease protein